MKKLLSVFTAIAIVLSLAVTANASQEYSVDDALAILRHEAGLVTLSSSDLAKYDLNKDGKVDVSDALFILRIMAGLVKSNAGAFWYDTSKVLYSEDFENGIGNWVARDRVDNTSLIAELTDEEAQSGDFSLKVSGRERSWEGVIIDITDYLRDDVLFYEVAVWVKVPETAPPARVVMSLEMHDIYDSVWYSWLDDYDEENGILSKYFFPAGTPNPNTTELHDPLYIIPEGYSTDDGWVLLRGTFFHFLPEHKEVHFYIETIGGRAAEMDFYIDNFVLLIG